MNADTMMPPGALALESNVEAHPARDYLKIYARLERLVAVAVEQAGKEFRYSETARMRALAENLMATRPDGSAPAARAELRPDLIERRQLIQALADAGWLRGTEILDPITPNHGSCCTCQDCGRPHDECACDHNEILGIIQAQARRGG